MYGYGDYSGIGETFELLGKIMAVMGLVILAIGILAIVSMWKIFEKAGKPGWAAIVPFYNTYVLAEITWGNGWYFLISYAGIVPVIGGIATLIYSIMTMDKLSKGFGKTTGFTIGLILLPVIFMPILAFSKKAQYVGAGVNRGTYDYSYGNGRVNTPAKKFDPMTGAPINNNPAYNFDPMTGALINNQPIVQPIEQQAEQVQNTPVQPVIIPNESGNEPTIEESLQQKVTPVVEPKIVGYDTNTGAPIYDNKQNNMQ